MDKLTRERIEAVREFGCGAFDSEIPEDDMRRKICDLALSALSGEPVGWIYKNGEQVAYHHGPTRPRDERASWRPVFYATPCAPGMVLVPREPTVAMCEAGSCCQDTSDGTYGISRERGAYITWGRMIEAALSAGRTKNG